MAERPYHAGYEISGIEPGRIFAALLNVGRFPEWSVGLRSVRALAPDGRETNEMIPGTTLEFHLQAAGFTHTVVSEISRVDPPHTLTWRYVAGATGTGGWRIEETAPGTVEMTLATDYRVEPAWLNRLAHRPFFRRLTEDLLRRSIRRLEHNIRQTQSPGRSGRSPHARGNEVNG